MTVISDPIELFLRAVFITLSLVSAAQFLNKGQKRDVFEEKILLYGFGTYFLFLAISNSIFCFIFYTIPGYYENHVFYGDFNQAGPLFQILDKLLRIIYAIGAISFILAFEITIKKTKYILSFIQIILIGIIIIAPFYVAYFFANYVLGVFSVSVTVIILIYLTKWAKPRFKPISTILLFGFGLIVYGLVLGNPDIKEESVIPLFIAPLLLLIGTLICLSPTLIKLERLVHMKKYLIILCVFLIIFASVNELIFIFYSFPMILISNHLLFSLIEIYACVKMIRTIKSQESVLIFQEKKDFLKLFARQEKIIEELIIEKSNDLISILDDNFNIEFINESTVKSLLGYDRNDLLGKRREDLIHPDDFKKMKKLQQFLQTSLEARADLRIQKRDGTYIWFEIGCVGFYDLEKNRKYLTIARDITEKQEAKKIIEYEHQKLLELNELKDDFIIRATHELKTPLSYLLGNSEIVYEEIVKSKESLKNMNEPDNGNLANFEELEILSKDMRDGILRINELIGVLLDISRIELQKVRINKENINISEIIINVVKSMESEAQRRNITISYEYPDQIYLKIDKTRTLEIFENLISNSLKYTPKGGKILISHEIRNNYLEIHVKDTGIGLTLQEQKKLFKKFTWIERKSDDLIMDGFGSSYGCGLYITKQLAKLHGGDVLVESKGNHQGSLFKVLLPLKKI